MSLCYENRAILYALINLTEQVLLGGSGGLHFDQIGQIVLGEEERDRANVVD
jgi:hypothetical protein